MGPMANALGRPDKVQASGVPPQARQERLIPSGIHVGGFSMMSVAENAVDRSSGTSRDHCGGDCIHVSSRASLMVIPPIGISAGAGRLLGPRPWPNSPPVGEELEAS